MKARDNPRRFLDAFGQAVRAERTRRSLSQEELCFRSGLDRTYISGIERGVRNPTLESMLKVAEALEVSLSALLRHAEKAFSKPS